MKTVSLDDAGAACFELVCPSDHEGGPGVAHGGWTASLMDEVLGQIVVLNGQAAIVGTLTTVFLRPVPVGYPVFARSWIERRQARKWHVAGELRLRNRNLVLARAQGIFVLRDGAAHYKQFADWLSEQPRPTDHTEDG